jgi:hypothetical protein
MSVEERVANIESDMGHVRSTLADLKNEAQELGTELHTFKIEVGKEFASVRGEIAILRTEMTKEFGLVRQEIAGARIETVSLKTEMVNEFGLVRTELANVKTTIERAKLWFVLIGISALWTVASGVGHALKLF